ncbi:MAG: hypothetical protein RIR97_991 [Pseudomonadota bacterium]|jgi:hypothetical protein
MQGLFFETDSGVKTIIRVMVMLIGFWTAWRAGRSAAEGWKNEGSVVIYTLMLAVAIRFIHHALFDGPMLSLQFYLIDSVVLMVFSLAGYRFTRANQMANNYYWLYEKTSVFSWKKKA